MLGEKGMVVEWRESGGTRVKEGGKGEQRVELVTLYAVTASTRVVKH